MNFPGKKGFLNFQIFQLSTTCKKLEEIDDLSKKKAELMDAETQADNGNFTRPSLGLGSTKHLTCFSIK